MGIDTSAALIVGLPSEQLGDYTYYSEVLEGLGLSTVSPHFDSDFSNWIIGITVAYSGDYDYCEVMGGLDWNIEEAKREFLTLTGKHGKLYISPDIT